MLVEEFKRLGNWGEGHRRLFARLILVLLFTLAVDAIGTVAIYFAERGVKSGDIHTWGDALFFTTVQLLTVSSQIKNPLTATGRIVDVGLELWAVVVVAGSAGAIATFFQSAE